MSEKIHDSFGELGDVSKINKNVHFTLIKSNERIVNSKLGKLGIIFGDKPHIYLSFIFIFILSISGLVFTFLICNKNYALEFERIWSIITPLITLTLGYIFGKQ